MATREQILEAQDLGNALVPTPEWAPVTEVHVRGLSGVERIQLFGDKALGQKIDLAKRFSQLIIAGCINEDGTQMFQHSDLEAVGGKNGVVLDRIADAIMEISGLTDDGSEELGKD